MLNENFRLRWFSCQRSNRFHHYVERNRENFQSRKINILWRSIRLNRYAAVHIIQIFFIDTRDVAYFQTSDTWYGSVSFFFMSSYVHLPCDLDSLASVRDDRLSRLHDLVGLHDEDDRRRDL